MNTTTAQASEQPAPIPIQRLAYYDPQVEQRVQQWLTSGQLLVWIPILSRQNFPDVPPQILQFADQYQEAMRWPIRAPQDLLQLPDGITGWLMPADAEDTDVACGLWEGEVYILGVTDRRTGRKQSLRGEVATLCQLPGNSAGNATDAPSQSQV
jgi:hypothetical protein